MNVGTVIHYPVPPHLQPAYVELGYKKQDFQIAETIHNEILSLPNGPTMSSEQIDYISAAISKVNTAKLG